MSNATCLAVGRESPAGLKAESAYEASATARICRKNDDKCTEVLRGSDVCLE